MRKRIKMQANYDCPICHYRFSKLQICYAKFLKCPRCNTSLQYFKRKQTIEAVK